MQDLHQSTSWVILTCDISELKQRRRRHRGPRLVNNKSMLYLRISHIVQIYSDLFSTPLALRISLGLICNYMYSVQFHTEIRKISRRRSRSTDYVELGQITLSFRLGWMRNVERFTTHGHSYCIALLITPSWRNRAPEADYMDSRRPILISVSFLFFK